MSKNQEIGAKGEHKAESFLLQHNFTILHTNFRHKRAEIDIIAQKNKCLHFIEVKTRKNNLYGYPEDFVSERKKELFAETVEYLLDEMKWNGDVQFDIIAITNSTDEIHYIEEAF